MNLPFDAWLVVVGLALGAGLAWLVLADMRRREDDVSASEMHAEAAWLADSLRQQGIAADADAVEEVLRLHRAYLAGIPDEGPSGRSMSAEDDLQPLPDEDVEPVPDDDTEPPADVPSPGTRPVAPPVSAPASDEPPGGPDPA